MIKSDRIHIKIRESSAVREYLYVAGEKIRSEQLRGQVETEVLSHIESYVEESMRDGVPLEQAIANALLHLGDAKVIRAGLYEANKPFYLRKSFYGPLAAVVVVLVAFLGAVEFYSHDARVLLSSRVQKMSRSLDLMIQDQKYLESLRLFENDSTGADFGSFANHRLVWSTSLIKPAAAPLAIPQRTSDALMGLGADWVSAGDDLGIDLVDLSWMSDLHAYGYWDLYRSGPGAGFAYLSKGNPYAVPVPNYLPFEGLARVALLRGIRDNKLEEAVIQVEHLARLMYSNETLMGAVIAVSLLKDNLQAVSFGSSRGLFAGKKPLYSSEDLERFQKVLVARSSYFDFINSKDTLAAVFSINAAQKSSPGFCHALDEGIRAMTFYQSFFDANFFYESDREQSIAYIDTVIESSLQVCRIAPARFLWKQRGTHSDQDGDFVAALNGTFDPARNAILKLAAKVPYVRESVGYMLLAMARPVFSEY